MTPYTELAQSVTFDELKVVSHSPELSLIGRGRSAVVFKIENEDKVIKRYFPECTPLAQVEADVYDKLVGVEYFPSCYEAGPGYLVIDYIQGKTIFDCLVNGVIIAEWVVQEVDKALAAARERGLHPSDVHIRNIMITPDEEVRLIDVARFSNDKEDRQWEDLKRAYYSLYQKPFFPKSLPESLLNAIGRWYVQGQLPFYRRSDDFLQNRHQQ